MAGEHSRSSGISIQFLLGVASSVVAAGLLAMLAVIFGVLNKPLTMPLWGYLSLLTIIIVAFAWILFLNTRNLRERVAHDAETLKDWEKKEHDWNAASERQDNDFSEAISQCSATERQLRNQITGLTAELATRDEVEFEDGLYYRKTDTERKQPLCRVCWETNEKATTVVKTMDDRGQRKYHCDVCAAWLPLPPGPRSPLEDDIPF
jgi:hypothetical protein